MCSAMSLCHFEHCTVSVLLPVIAVYNVCLMYVHFELQRLNHGRLVSYGYASFRLQVSEEYQ